ncbi:hypothetical protein [Nocardia sp. CDC160]|uniref:hypothetical protein n=1 Tax=Nocardia sp. CDC160 TaxID=3112166 RepID=UPI002DB72DE7|nr:hypothetical protein [Nocardia sp. CDC160]MEC3919041.1 hypothetical protein [Nocardia sp. CDC160]
MTRLGIRVLNVLSAVAVCAMAVGCTESPHTVPATTRPQSPVGSLDTLGTTSEVPTTVAATPSQTTVAPQSSSAQPAFTEDDARYTVRRYLSRWTGQPLQPDDTEGRYPLVCTNSVLANNPGKLTGTVSFANDRMTARRTGDNGAEVTVPVTNSATVTQVVTFTLRAAAQGYCIEDIIN